MKNRYIFFRTDRIGDFLLSAILMKSIKRSDKNSYITVVASQKNYSYIKNFNFVDNVILFPDSFLSKIFFYLTFIFRKFYLIAVLDGKKRSLYFSLLTRSKFKFLFTYKKFYTVFLKFFFTKVFYDKDCNNKISEIKDLLKFLNLNLDEDDYNIINKSSVSSRKLYIPFSKKFILLHLDEKWIFNDYIKTYNLIEPKTEDALINFLEILILHARCDIFISTGNLPNKFTFFLRKHFVKQMTDIYEFKIFDNKVFFFDNLDFLSLEKLILSSYLLISCHGAVTHVGASFNINIIDIVDKSESLFFDKWTSHFKNYKKLYRVEFHQLSKDIINLL